MQFQRSSLPKSTLPYSFGPHVRQVLERLPQSVVAKLSEEELLALYQAMTSSPRHHAVEMRLSLPLLPKRLYFVTLLGLERRGQKRVENKKNWNSATIGMAMTLSLLTGLSLCGAGYRVIQGKKVALASEVTIHPTALPWIEKKADCQGKSRHWQEGLCYEQDHDPQF